jgi:hypothetical protein
MEYLFSRYYQSVGSFSHFFAPSFNFSAQHNSTALHVRKIFKRLFRLLKTSDPRKAKKRPSRKHEGLSMFLTVYPPHKNSAGQPNGRTAPFARISLGVF